MTLGVFDIDVRACHIDFLACGAHKWLLGEMGAGIFYCRHDLLDELQLGAYVGASSVLDPFNFLDYNFTLQPTSDRFAIGVPNSLGTFALNASLGLLLEVGIDRIAERVLHLTDLFIQDMQERGFPVLTNLELERRSGIVVIAVPDAEAAAQRLLAAGVVVSVRGGGIRVSPHFYNTEEEVLRVGEVMGQGAGAKIPVETGIGR
jgi:selenocysteine lyase/cysteine desulfurase